MKWEKIFANHLSSKGLVCKIHKDYMQLKAKKKKKKIQLKKSAKGTPAVTQW